MFCGMFFCGWFCCVCSVFVCCVSCGLCGVGWVCGGGWFLLVWWWCLNGCGWLVCLFGGVVCGVGCWGGGGGRTRGGGWGRLLCMGGMVSGCLIRCGSRLICLVRSRICCLVGGLCLIMMPSCRVLVARLRILVRRLCGSLSRWMCTLRIRRMVLLTLVTSYGPVRFSRGIILRCPRRRLCGVGRMFVPRLSGLVGRRWL